MKKMYLAVVLLASLVLGACSNDTESESNNSQQSPSYPESSYVWKIDWTNNQEKPKWSEPDGSIYENWTILMVKIEETLQPFVSDGDMMALFVNGELRGLAKPAVSVETGKTGNASFLMKAYGNETDTETVNMTLKYYNQKLRHIFTLSDKINLSSDEITGVDEAYIPEFTKGSSKYPIVKTVAVESILAKVGITPAAGNKVGAFVGTECRGLLTIPASGSTPLVIYGRNAGESVTLKYYDATKGMTHTIDNALTL